MHKLPAPCLPVFFILLSLNCFAQRQKNPQWDEDMSGKDSVSAAKKTVDTIREPPSVTLHIEFSGKVGGGIIFEPFLWERYDDHLTFEDHSQKGYLTSAGFQTTLAGKRNFAFVIEADFVSSSQHLKYISGQFSSAGGHSNNCNYTMNIQKAELAFMTKHFIGKKHHLSLNLGLDIGFETAKLATGTIEVDGNFIGGQYSHEILQYTGHQLKIYNESGILAGIGYNRFLKNNKIIFFDLRGGIHRVIGFDNAPMRFPELGLSIGYIFFSSKGNTIYQTL